MALRLIEVFLPQQNVPQLKEALKEREVLGIWEEVLSGNEILVRILLPGEETEAVLDLMEKRFAMVSGFRIMLLPVEATVPRPEPAEEAPSQQKESQPELVPEARVARISREELYADITDSAKLTTVYVVMVVLSSIVAAAGILRNNVIFIIGAMVIAPLLGPNVALSLATTLGDVDLAQRALKANVVGIFATLGFSIVLGIFLTVNPDIPEIASRTKVELGDIALALASGSAGALAFTTGIATALVGVMVAVALLPPLVTLGLLLGSGHVVPALGALLLLLTNLICINLAGVMTFLAQGIHPITWWEADRAKRATHKAIALWISLLVILVVVILLSQRS
jgi:uncharacterized hydrophobic protein (TIGR00341 family)